MRDTPRPLPTGGHDRVFSAASLVQMAELSRCPNNLNCKKLPHFFSLFRVERPLWTLCARTDNQEDLVLDNQSADYEARPSVEFPRRPNSFELPKIKTAQVRFALHASAELTFVSRLTQPLR